MARLFVLCSLFVSTSALAIAQSTERSLVGTWQLISRADHDSLGNVVPEPSLGPDPIGYLVYDAAGHVFVQMMARHRTSNPMQITSPAESNNLAQVGGYDAYFGTYRIDPARGEVVHYLEGALSPSDVGRKLTRRFTVDHDTLTIQFKPGGEKSRITRTLIWHRAGQ